MSDTEEMVERQLKLVLLGDFAVGKSSVATRYCNNTFSKQYVPTSGVEFLLKRDVIKSNNVSMHLWDVSGDSRKMLDKYVFNANIIAVVFDITNEQTFLNLPRWVKTLREMCSGHGNPPLIYIIGNKADMEHQRAVKLERQKELAAELRVATHVASARTGEGINQAFHHMIADFLGLKLTRSELEEVKSVVRAEISTHSEICIPQATKLPSTSSSSVCSIQ